MRRFFKWLFSHESEVIMSDWLTEDEIKNYDSNEKKLYKICQSRKQFNDNMRDLVWISVSIVIIVGILTYFHFVL